MKTRFPNRIVGKEGVHKRSDLERRFPANVYQWVSVGNLFPRIWIGNLRKSPWPAAVN